MHAPTTGVVRSSIPTVVGRTVWLVGWVFVTVFAWFEVAKHGWISGGTPEATLLTTVAVVAFILPDLTFVVGAGQPVERGYLPRRAVPYYNALHRFWPPLLLTTVVGVIFAPLNLLGLVLFVAGLSWMAHVALDRAAGYGLRNADGSR